MWCAESERSSCKARRGLICSTGNSAGRRCCAWTCLRSSAPQPAPSKMSSLHPPKGILGLPNLQVSPPFDLPSSSLSGHTLDVSQMQLLSSALSVNQTITSLWFVHCALVVVRAWVGKTVHLLTHACLGSTQHARCALERRGARPAQPCSGGQHQAYRTRVGCAVACSVAAVSPLKSHTGP